MFKHLLSSERLLWKAYLTSSLQQISFLQQIFSHIEGSSYPIHNVSLSLSVEKSSKMNCKRIIWETYFKLSLSAGVKDIQNIDIKEIVTSFLNRLIDNPGPNAYIMYLKMMDIFLNKLCGIGVDFTKQPFVHQTEKDLILDHMTEAQFILTWDAQTFHFNKTIHFGKITEDNFKEMESF